MAIVFGRTVRRGGGEPAKAEGGWDEARQLEADLLSELLVGNGASRPPRAAVLVGLRITGRLNLEGAELRAPLIAHNCRFDEPVNLMAARAPEIILTACRIPGIAANQLETRGDLDLTNTILEGIALLGSHIGGQLLLEGARLTGARYPFDLGDGVLRPPESPSGPIREIALLADRLQVDQAMSCKGFAAEREVRLVRARIRGQLVLEGAVLSDDFIADGLEVGQGMSCRESFAAEGEVRLVSAHVGLQLSFDSAKLSKGLIAGGLQVDQGLYCGAGFAAEGEVSLVGARIGGELSFYEAKLSNASTTINLTGGRVDGDVFLAFASPPKAVDLTDSLLGSVFDREEKWPTQLRLRGCDYTSLQAAEERRQGELRHAGGQTWRVRWPLRHLQASPDVARRLRWIRLAEEGHVEHKPREGLLRTVARAARSLVSTQFLLDVREDSPQELRRTADGYEPSPYTHLIAFYRREGRDGAARQVAYQRERRHQATLGLPHRIWSVFLQATVGYGYKPLRALALLGVMVLIGSLVFSSLHNEGGLSAVKDEHPPFVASIYTLDRLIPVVSFGLRDAFAPSGAAQWWAFCYTLLGWLLTIAVVAGLNAAFRRD